MSDELKQSVALGCDQIIQRLETYAISDRTCEDVAELESYHDALVREVRNLTSLLQTAVRSA